MGDDAIEVLGRLGRGGMAEVMLARRASGERVALKRILPDNAGDARAIRMLRDEARIASALRHPCIVRVLDVREDGAAPTLVLEWIDGSDLERLSTLAREVGVAPSAATVAAIAREVARGLAYAHAACDEAGAPLELVHRDVSPSNVLVARDGRVLLSDFGIARARGRLERTTVGTTKGKLAYMAPEQMLGGNVDGRSDTFALGCCIHALATGRSPLADEDAVAAVMAGETPPLDAALDPRLRAIVERACAASRVRRYASADAMVEALDAMAEREACEEVGEWLERLVAAAGAERVFPGASPVVHRDAEAATRLNPVRARRSAGRGALGLAALGLIVGIAALAFVIVPSRNAPESTDTLAGSHSVAPVEASPPSVDPRDAPDPSAPDPSAPATLAVARDSLTEGGAPQHLASTEHAPPAPRRPSSSAPPASSDPEASSAAPSVGAERRVGYLVVGGPGAARARVVVDGVQRDFAPTTLELTLGAHEIAVHDPADGSMIATHSVVLREDHTALSPARWRVASP